MLEGLKSGGERGSRGRDAWTHRLNGHEFEITPKVEDLQEP